MLQSSFFDLENRFKKLDSGDHLRRLDNVIDWEMFRETLETQPTERKSKAGRKPYDVVMMFKGLVIQHMYNLSDEQLEFQIRDRFTFQRFLGLTLENIIPDQNTFWDFRERLIKADLIVTLFNQFDQQLEDKGFIAEKGQIVDASFVEAPKQRNTRLENAEIKKGNTPESFEENPHKKSQKDIDARWTKKNNEVHYGYKNHATVDTANKLIRAYDVTSAEVHDSHVLLQILTENSSKKVYADSAYRNEDNERLLTAAGYESEIIERAYRNTPLTSEQVKNNKKKSAIRVRVEHVFGSMTNEQDAMHVRVIGLARATAKIGLSNLVYNLRRFETLCRISVPAV